MSIALSAIASAALKGSAVCVGVLLACILLRRAAPSLRHLLWLAALASFLAAPIISIVLPSIAVRSPIPTVTLAPTAHGSLAEVTPGEEASVVVVPGQPADPSPTARVIDWQTVLLVLWAGGVLSLLLRMALASIGLRRLVRRAAPLSEPQRVRAEGVASAAPRGHRVPRFLQAELVEVPMTLRALRPLVILPPKIASSAGRVFDAVVAHELAHVRRCDALTGRIAYVVCSIFWFVPFAWLALSRLRVEQEKACDEEAMAMYESRSRYAELLVRLGASLRRPSLLALLSAQAAGIRTLEERIRSILMTPRGTARRSRAARPMIMAAFAGLILPLSMMRCAPAPAPAVPAATGTAPEVRLELTLKSGGTIVAPDDTFVAHDFPTTWPIEPQSSHRRGVITQDSGTMIQDGGIDIAGTMGWPIVAAGSGVVSSVGFNSGYGNFVIIQHRLGYQTLYGRLQAASVLTQGDRVSAGQQIGTLGSTGNSTGPHLHFAMFLNGENVDPREVLDGRVSAVAVADGRVLQSTTTSVEMFSGTGFQPDKAMVEPVLRWPVKGDVGHITSTFGPAVNPFTELAYYHMGIDIAWTPGTPIVAAVSGTVVETGFTAELGNYVRIEGSSSVGTYYAHLGEGKVTKGQAVMAGQTIALLGNSGLSTGPHVHFEVTVKGNLVDPLIVLPAHREP